jgi:osmotically-inducible protein OsmY
MNDRTEHANFGGDWARDAHRGGMSGEYARDGEWSDDERLRASVSQRLTDHEAIDASDVDVGVANGEITLSGTCRTRGEKRLAEDLAWACGGVHDVHNRLTVADRENAIGKASE